MNYVDEINSALESLLPQNDDIVSQAMRYSVRNGGKRIRPRLVLEFCKVCGGDYRQAMELACAVEMIHTYSLIHDDLPCMDDDDLRRGKPSCHVAYGEANALLAGDGLLTLAFEILAKSPLPAQRVVSAVKVLAQAAGVCGMVGGQVMDLQNEGALVDVDTLRKTDELKTGELIRCSCVLGCIAAGADEEKIKAAERYAYGIGIAFQITDDILDVTGDAAAIGKPVGSDERNHKSTYVTLTSLEEARRLARKAADRAHSALAPLGEKAAFLDELAEYLVTRDR